MSDNALSQEIRALVRAAIAEVLPALRTSAAARDETRTGARASGARRSEAAVRIASDDDLNAFARKVAELAADGGARQDVLEGRIRFRLDGAAPQAVGPAPAPAPAPSVPAATSGRLEVDQGVLNERRIVEIARNHAELAVSANVVVTPLARDKARACGLKIVRKGS